MYRRTDNSGGSGGKAGKGRIMSRVPGLLGRLGAGLTELGARGRAPRRGGEGVGGLAR